MSAGAFAVHVDDSLGSIFRAEMAAKLAVRLGGRAALFAVAVKPGEPYGAGSTLFADSVAALRGEVEARRIAEARAALQAAQEKSGLAGEVLLVEPDRVIIDVASHLRPASLIIAGPPRLNGSTLDDDVFEAALFHSGRPVILMPHDRNGAAIGHSVAVAWKNCRESARAIHEAAPLMAKAERVQFIVVHGEDDPRFFGTDAMERMQDELRLRGATVVDPVLLKANAGVGEKIGKAALDAGADLLVMGAYGRWRMSELMFGGVTQHLLTEMKLPLFLAH